MGLVFKPRIRPVSTGLYVDTDMADATVRTVDGELHLNEATFHALVNSRSMAALFDRLAGQPDGEYDVPRFLIQPYRVEDSAVADFLPEQRSHLNTVTCPTCGGNRTRQFDTRWWCDPCSRPVSALQLLG